MVSLSLEQALHYIEEASPEELGVIERCCGSIASGLGTGSCSTSILCHNEVPVKELRVTAVAHRKPEILQVAEGPAVMREW
mgnify:CR=1 FL=1